MQALVAFVRVDMAFWMNRLDHALIGAAQARITALLVALQPVKCPHAGGDGKSSAQRAQIPAVKSFDEQSGSKLGDHKQDIGPGPIKFQNDRGLEWFDLRIAFSQFKRIQRQAKKPHENHVFDGP